MSETLLDVKGLNCPLPVLRANRTLRGLAPGARLRVLATDRAAVADFQAYCRETGHALLAWSEEGGVLSFLIRRRPEPDGKDRRRGAGAMMPGPAPLVRHPRDRPAGAAALSALRHDSARIAAACCAPWARCSGAPLRPRVDRRSPAAA